MAVNLFGCKRNEAAVILRKLHNEELRELYPSLDTSSVMTARTMR